MKSGWLKKDLTLFLGLLLVSGLLFLGDEKGWLNPVRSTLERPFLALQKPLYSFSISFGSFFDQFSSRQKQAEEIIRLQSRLQQLAVDQSLLNACVEENIQSRRLLGSPLPASWRFLPVKIISQAGQMKIDKGVDGGVKEGMTVVFENVLVGKVIDVEAKSALVQTLLDPAVKIPVVIKKPLSGGTEAVQAAAGVQGRGLLRVGPGGNLLVGEILQAEDVSQGDLVLTSGEADWLPDLVVGTVNEVSGREAELYQEALVEPLLDYGQLRAVFVVMDW